MLKKLALLLALIAGAQSSLKAMESARMEAFRIAIQNVIKADVIKAVDDFDLPRLESYIKNGFNVNTYFSFKKFSFKKNGQREHETLLHLFCKEVIPVFWEQRYSQGDGYRRYLTNKKYSFYLQAIQLLLQNGANPNLPNSLAFYPLDNIITSSMSDPEIVLKIFKIFKQYSSYSLALRRKESTEELLYLVDLPLAQFINNNAITLPEPSYDFAFKMIDTSLTKRNSCQSRDPYGRPTEHNLALLKARLLILPPEMSIQILQRLVFPEWWRLPFIQGLYSPTYKAQSDWIMFYDKDMVNEAKRQLQRITQINTLEQLSKDKQSLISALPKDMRDQLQLFLENQ